MGNKYVVLDLETSTKESYGRIANPFDKDNYIVSTGLKYSDGRKIKTHINREKAVPEGDWLAGVDAIVGINLKFDLLYLWKHPVLRKFFKRGGRIYDCQYARYFITAQQEKYASMDSMAKVYGLPLKPDKIKEYWKSGMDTIEIPEQELLDYLDHDLDTTEEIFKCVAREAHSLGMSAMIRERMDSLCGNIEMEFNGLRVDRDVADKNEKKLREEITSLYKQLEQYSPELPEGVEFNWSSGKQLSAFLFGGPIKYKSRTLKRDFEGNVEYYKKTVEVPAVDPQGNKVYYKTGAKAGQLKTKKAKVDNKEKPKYVVGSDVFYLKGITKPKKEWELKEPGFYKTGEDVIKTLSAQGIEVANILAKLKKKEKDLSAFYSKGMLRYCQDGVIHHTLNNVQTDTGRLSSSKPNAQQIPRGNTSDVREMFISHFEGGEVSEVDFSSLEVVIQAWISKDPNMIKNVNEGVDFHSLRLAAKLGEDYNDVVRKAKKEKDPYYDLERTKAKGFSFQRAYGAGATAIAASTGMSVDEVKQFIDAENKMYPNVEKYNAWVARQVEKNAEETGEYINGVPVKFGWHRATTGTNARYGFTQQEAPDFMKDKGVEVSFSPTQMKNYSIQGEAGGVVSTAVGMVWRKFVETDNFNNTALLMNTVHDCIWISLAKGAKEYVIPEVEKAMVAIPERYKKVYNSDVPVVFRVESEVGPNMKDLH